MKKNAVVFLALAVFCTQVFATEFFVTPKLGLSNISISQKVSGVESYGDTKPNKLSWTSAVVGLGLGVVTDHNIMILFNTDLMFGGSAKAKIGYSKYASKYLGEGKLKGGLYFWQPSLILGYSFKPNDALRCNFGVGIAIAVASNPMAKEAEASMGGGISNTDKRGTPTNIEVGCAFPIHVDIQYYFMDHIGVIVELQDVIGSGKASAAGYDISGVCNTFTLKVGQAFKF